ncbi:hypothetical protein F0U44_10725 [Nocardioides humilatus]|uniref:DUF222 domain-containing protein n=1 Tax=Nocardioides humilatus TaxID=2607660 RepID=A0A5B1LFI1_9ACTN|nr:hypothetical protein [Nocardioides humilatus]KAA1418938.1 hypothetical protein F0U44_10725 [Nocardioides humilatus]
MTNMTYDDLTSLDSTATLAAVESRVRARRAGDVEDMELVLHWCDLHSGDPQAEPGAAPKRKGGNYLRQIGGDGTPKVADLSFAELAMARRAGEVSTSNFAADALDLRHRMPLLGAAVLRLEIDQWLWRKIVRLTRKLSNDRVGLVDAAVAAAVHQSPGRLIELAEAKVIEADPDLHRAKLEEDARSTGVWLNRVRPGEITDDDGEPATRRITAKVSAGTGVRADENVDDLAEVIFDNTETDADGDRPSFADCRLQAFEMLMTNPHQAAAFLSSIDPDPSVDPEPEPVKPRRKRKPATITIFVTDKVLCGQVPGVARVEDYGPVLAAQLPELFEGRDVVVQPVIDLSTVKAVNSYEHPAAVKQRTLLRTGGDVFPHSTSRSTARLDHDHPTPYDPKGPPGQTGDHNDGPLTRRHHRAKTHLTYECRQIGLGAYRWISPHGLARSVTRLGTRDIEILRDPGGRAIGEIYGSPGFELLL